MSAPSDAAIARARLHKATAIAATLAAAGATPADVDTLPDSGRRAAEAAAGVRRSSDATWAMVRDILSARAAVSARVAAESEADIFRRL